MLDCILTFKDKLGNALKLKIQKNLLIQINYKNAMNVIYANFLKYSMCRFVETRCFLTLGILSDILQCNPFTEQSNFSYSLES